MVTYQRRQQEQQQAQRDQAQAHAQELAAEAKRVADEAAERARALRERANRTAEEHARRAGETVMPPSAGVLGEEIADAAFSPDPSEAAAFSPDPWEAAAFSPDPSEAAAFSPDPLEAAAAPWWDALGAASEEGQLKLDGPDGPLGASGWHVPVSPINAPVAAAPITAAPRSLMLEAALRRQAEAAVPAEAERPEEPSGEQREAEEGGEEQGGEATEWERQAYLWPNPQQLAHERQQQQQQQQQQRAADRARRLSQDAEGERDQARERLKRGRVGVEEGQDHEERQPAAGELPTPLLPEAEADQLAVQRQQRREEHRNGRLSQAEDDERSRGRELRRRVRAAEGQSEVDDQREEVRRPFPRNRFGPAYVRSPPSLVVPATTVHGYMMGAALRAHTVEGQPDEQGEEQLRPTAEAPQMHDAPEGGAEQLAGHRRRQQ